MYQRKTHNYDIWASSWIRECCNLACESMAKRRMITSNAEAGAGRHPVSPAAGRLWGCNWSPSWNISLWTSAKRQSKHWHFICIRGLSQHRAIHQRQSWIGKYFNETASSHTLLNTGTSWNGELQVCRGLCYSSWPFENLISDYFERGERKKEWRQCAGLIYNSRFDSQLYMWLLET